jgi:hypothetical protein
VNHKTQRGRILELLIRRGNWVPLPELLALGIAQYSARIHDLRALGFRIENRRERVNGALHTYFRLNGGSAIAPRMAPVSREELSRQTKAREWIARARSEPAERTLFDMERQHRDEN